MKKPNVSNLETWKIKICQSANSNLDSTKKIQIQKTSPFWKNNFTFNQNNKEFCKMYIIYLYYIDKEKSNVLMFGIWIPKFDKTISNNKFVFVCDNDCYNNL